MLELNITKNTMADSKMFGKWYARVEYKVNCGLGNIPTTGPDGTGAPDFTKQSQPAISTVKLLAQATGDFTKKELNDDVTFRWTKKASETINAIIDPDGNASSGSSQSGNQGGNGGNTGGGGNQGGGNEPDPGDGRN